jgi:hypothetical protein
MPEPPVPLFAYFYEVLGLKSDPGRAVPDFLVTQLEFLAALRYNCEHASEERALPFRWHGRRLNSGTPLIKLGTCTRVAEDIRTGHLWFFHHIAVGDFVDGPALFATQPMQCLCGSER